MLSVFSVLLLLSIFPVALIIGLVSLIFENLLGGKLGGVVLIFSSIILSALSALVIAAVLFDLWYVVALPYLFISSIFTAAFRVWRYNRINNGPSDQ